MNISSRLSDVGTSIFTVMSRMAVEHQAINLSQGFPDFPVSPELIELVAARMREGHNQYAPMPGAMPLKQIIAQVVEQSYGRPTNPETEVVITAGGTEALFATIAAFIRSGDEVIIFDPSYDSYSPSVRLNGGVPVPIDLKAPDFSIDWDEVKSKITSRTRMIMINTPHNPCGSVLKSDDLKTLELIAAHHDLIVLSDEVYERLVFDGYRHESVLRYPALAARSVAVFSFGKTFHVTGWKAGYAVGPENLIREVVKTHQFITFSVNTPVQVALAEYMKDKTHYIHLGSFFEQKRDFFVRQLKGSSFEVLPCHGSYFQLLSYRNISHKKEMEMAEWLTKEKKVASIPVSVFYHNKKEQQLLRFCFAKGEETLRKAGEILRTL